MLEMEIVDRWVWKDSGATKFSVKSAYGFLRGEGSEEVSRRYNFFWKIKALPSVHVTAWRVMENKVLVRLIWREEESGFRVICVACVGGTRSQQIICFANAELLG